MTFDTEAAIAAIVARLTLIPDHDAMDGPPNTTPARRYFCVYDQTGAGARRKYTADPTQLYLPVQVSCVGRTRSGVRESAQLARNALAGWTPVAGGTPLIEDGSNPILTDGPTNDLRHTWPLTMHCYLPKEM